MTELEFRDRPTITDPTADRGPTRAGDEHRPTRSEARARRDGMAGRAARGADEAEPSSDEPEARPRRPTRRGAGQRRPSPTRHAPEPPTERAASPSRSRGGHRCEAESTVAEPTTERRPRRRPRRTPSRSRRPDRGPSAGSIADALRAAGVRYAFTVPGESFLGLLDALRGRRDPGRRDPPRRRRRVHGRGPRPADRPPGGLPRHARRRRREPGHRHPHRAPGFDPDVRRRRRRSSAAFRGREAFQEIDQVATLGGLAKWAAEPRTATERRRRVMAEAVRQALGGRPGPVLLSLPEDLLDETMPDDAVVEISRPAVARADRRRDPARSSSSSRCGRAPGHPRRRRRPARPDVDRADPLRRAAPGPGRSPPGAAPTSSPTTIRSTSGWPGSARRAVGPRATRRGRRAPRPRLAPERADDLRLQPAAARASAGRTSTSSPARRRRARRRRRSSITADAKAFLQGRQRAAPRPGRARRRAASPTRQANNRDDRAAWEAATRRRRRRHGTGRASIPGGSSRRSAGSCPTTRS